MASIYRRARSPYWWVKFRDHEGKVARVSTRTTSEAQAREAAAELEDAVNIARTRRGTLRDAAIARLVELGYLTTEEEVPEIPSRDDRLKLEALALSHPSVQSEKAKRPQDHKAHMARLREFCAWAGIDSVTELTPAIARRWINHLAGEGMTREQIRHRIIYLRAAAATAPEFGAPNPLGPLRIPRTENVEGVTLSLAELRALLASDLHVRYRIAIGLMGGMGLRLSELCRLQWGDVSGGAVHVGARAKKNDPAARSLPLLPPLAALLDEHRAYRLAALAATRRPASVMGPVIFTRQHALPAGEIDIRAASRAISWALEEVLPGTPATAKSLRKSFATVATWDLGIPPEVVEAFMGRSVSGLGATTNRHYLARAKVDRLRPHAEAIGKALWGTPPGHTDPPAPTAP